MKKLLYLVAFAALPLSTYANSLLPTSQLKSMTCADLAVEKANAQRALNSAEQKLSTMNAANPANTVSKWAGVAGGALSSFAGKSETAARASAAAQNIANQNPQANNAQDAATLQQYKENSKANIENIAIYQASKKCAKY